MKIEKLIIFLILIAFLVSVGGTSAQDINNTSTDVADVDVVLTDTLYAENNNNTGLESINTNDTEVLVQDSFSSDSSKETKEESLSLTVNDTSKSANLLQTVNNDYGDTLQNLIQNGFNRDYDVSLFGSNYSNGVVLREDSVPVIYDNVVIVNPDFEDAGKPVGWDYSSVSIISYQKNAKNGKKFLALTDEGYISQAIHLDTVDYISFWYMSENKGSKIQVLLDDESLFEYTINTVGMGNWEQVLVNVSNYTGFHTLKLVQKGSKGYLDYFDLIRNDDISVNFTLGDFSLVGDNLTLSFNVNYAFGRITGWLWDFGDGTNSTLQNVTHSFKNGHYTVSLIVYNENTTKVLYYTIPITFPTNERIGVEYNSVQSAIDDAVDGDVINVYNNIFYNRYVEDLVIDKSVTLNFFNCSLMNSSIAVIDSANVVINEICLDNVSLHVMDGSNLTFTQLGVENMIITDCNIVFSDTSFSDTFITFYNSNVTFRNCNISNGGIFAWDSNLIVNDCVFTNCSEAIVQHDGESRIMSNIFHDNSIGVNIVSGSSDLGFNTFYYNDVGLIFNSSNVSYNDNWWGCNNPVYVYNASISNCDVCQVGGIKSVFDSWLVLNITQSDVLDYDYWIAGITYYNITFDLSHNNLGQDITNKGFLKTMNLDFSNTQNYPYLNAQSTNSIVVLINSIVVCSNVNINHNYGESIFTLNYLTSNLTQLNLTVLNQNYTVSLVNDSNSPKISYITPSCVFNNNLTIEIISNDSDAVIFYTLDGTNSAYSPTRLIYTGPLVINESITLHYTVIDKLGNFQKMFLDNFWYDAPLTCQDVWVELVSDVDLRYGLKGLISGKSSTVIYNHPFIIKEPTVIKFESSSYYTYRDFRINFYSFDYSCDYIKNSSKDNNRSNAIWGRYQGDNYNSGVSNNTGSLSNRSAWSNFAFSSSSSAVIDSKGHIIVAGDDGYLYYLNNQGLVIWRYGTTSRIICTPTIGYDGNIYFSNWMNSSVYCLSPQGQLLWKYELGDYNLGSSPVFGLDNKLYIITSNSGYSTLFVFKDGILKSKNIIPMISGSTPAVDSNGTLYMVSANHELVIVNCDGSLRKSILLDSGGMPGVGVNFNDKAVHCSVSIGSDGLIYVVNYIHSERSDAISFIFIDGVPYVNRMINYYFAINAYYPNGTCKWSIKGFNYTGSFKFHEFISGTPTYYNGVLYIAGNNNLIAVNSTDGDVLWMKSIASSGSTASSPLLSADEVLYVTSSNMIYAFNLTGDKLWEYELTGKYGNPISYSSPVLSNDGTLIVTTNQGIFAFRDIAADFTYYHVNGTAASIQFVDKSTPGNNRYYWMFGDGNFSREQNPIHEYATGGKYRVVLLVEHNGTIDLARNTTIEVIYKDIVPPSNVTAYIGNSITSGGIFNQTQTVTLDASDVSSFNIYYTVDGSNPVNSSTRRLYTGPFEVEVDTVLSMVAIDVEGNIGNVTCINFKISDAINIPDLVNSSLISDIQALLDNAEPGSKILFNQDVLNGANFTISKPLNIISNNNTGLIGNGNQAVFTFTANASGSILNGFTVDNTNAYGILINNACDITVKNCQVNVTNSTAIYINSSSDINVLNSNVYDSINGIVVNQSSNVSIDCVSISDCSNNGIWVYKSNITTISNSLLDDNGKDPYKLESGINSLVINQNPLGDWDMLNFEAVMPASESKTTQILIDDSKGTGIYNNTLNYGYFGIRLYHNTDGVVMDNNIFYESVGDAILLTNRYSNVNITHNMIDGCYNGIDFMGYSENVTIKQNTIKNLHEHENDLYSFGFAHLIEQLAGYVYETYFPDDQFFNHCYNGIQVSYPASNFDEGNTVMIDNVVIKLQHRSWESRKYKHYINAGCDSYGYNLMDGSDSYHGSTTGATHYVPGKVDLVVDRIGDATFRLRLINRLNNHYLSEIPEFDVTFKAGAFSQTVKFINDSAIATFDVASVVSDVEAIISAEIRTSAHFDMPITEGYSSSNRAYDPGLEKGEAYNNPDPVIPKVPPEGFDYDSNFNLVPVNPTTPVDPTPEIPDTGEGSGTGSGNGNGSGDGRFDGNGNGSSAGNGNGTHGSSDTPVSGYEGQTSSNSTSDIISQDTTGQSNSTDTNQNSQDTSNDVMSGEETKQADDSSSDVGESAASLAEAVQSQSNEADPVGVSAARKGNDISIEGESSGGEGETPKAYEVTKQINVENINEYTAIFIVLLALISVIIGYVKKRYYEGGEI